MNDVLPCICIGNADLLLDGFKPKIYVFLMMNTLSGEWEIERNGKNKIENHDADDISLWERFGVVSFINMLFDLHKFK